MASSLTYQLQHQQQPQLYDKHDGASTETTIPSPPHSSCGEEHAALTSSVTRLSASTQHSTDDGSNDQTLHTSTSSIPQPIQQHEHEQHSLQSQLSNLTLQAISNSLPANYTIDHSSIKSSLHQALATTVAAAAAAAAAAATTAVPAASNPPGINANHTTPIPIETTSCRRGSSHLNNHSLRGGNTLSYGSNSNSTIHHHHHHLSLTATSSAVATAAATGGLSIRHSPSRRPSSSSQTINIKQRVLSPPPASSSSSSSTSHSYQHSNIPNTVHLSSTSLPTTTTTNSTYRCEECAKVYKHPSCLTKHRWEHSEEWELTSKLLLTKHQQVQMLEAAAILVSMDPSSTTTTDHSRQQRQQQQLQQLQQIDMDDEDGEVDILNDDDGDDDDESIQVDIDDDDNDMMMEMDQDDDYATILTTTAATGTTGTMNQEEHTFPSMVGSTPAMLPSSFTTTTHYV